MENLEIFQQENICLFDWLSFTVRDRSPDDVIGILGLEHVTWKPKERGARGYKSGVYYESISIFYDGSESMGVWCDMSGSGCRTFEDASVFSWQQLFASLEKNGCNVTRLDVAFDDHSGILDLQQLQKDVQAVEFVSKAQKVRTEWSLDQQTGIEGRTVYIGSPSSRVIIRIYDKAAEREKIGEHWIRVEMQMRDTRAWQYVVKSGGAAGEIFAGVLTNYVRFIDPDPLDSNRWRWPMKKYWADLIAGAEAIKLYSNPGREYNEKKTRQFVFQHAGNAIAACREMYGEDGFWERLENRGTAPNPKYDGVVRDYLAEQAGLAVDRQLVVDLHSGDPERVARARALYDERAAQRRIDEQERAERRRQRREDEAHARERMEEARRLHVEARVRELLEGADDSDLCKQLKLPF